MHATGPGWFQIGGILFCGMVVLVLLADRRNGVTVEKAVYKVTVWKSERIKNLTDQLDAAKEESAKLTDRSDTAEAKSATLTDQLNAAEATCTDVTNQMNTTEAISGRVTAQLDTTQTENTKLLQDNANQAGRIEFLRGKISELNEDVGVLNERLNAVQDDLAATKETLLEVSPLIGAGVGELKAWLEGRMVNFGATEPKPQLAGRVRVALAAAN